MGGSSSGARDRVGIYDASGVFQRTVRRIIRVVGPASYATGGFQVDCSAYFSRVVSAVALRQFTTATGVAPANHFVLGITETGTNTYANAKFQCVLYRSFSTQTPTFTGAALGGGVSCGSVGCLSNHPNTTTVPTGTVSSITPQAPTQQTAGYDASAVTHEFLVEGVPV